MAHEYVTRSRKTGTVRLRVDERISINGLAVFTRYPSLTDGRTDGQSVHTNTALCIVGTLVVKPVDQRST